MAMKVTRAAEDEQTRGPRVNQREDFKCQLYPCA